MQAFANYVHSLKVTTGEKEPQPYTLPHGLHPNTELQPCEPRMWPQFFVSNHLITYIMFHKLAIPYNVRRLEAKNSGHIGGPRG